MILEIEELIAIVSAMELRFKRKAKAPQWDMAIPTLQLGLPVTIHLRRDDSIVGSSSVP